MKEYCVIGLMSGTSLDGLDIACCTFTDNQTSTTGYKILKTQFIPYSADWKERLKKVHRQNAFDLAKADTDFGRFLGEAVKKFTKTNHLKPQLIASHGHTIFHEPQKKFTTQIGDGAAIYAITGIPVVSDLRNVDVHCGGQGAPLVPFGDKTLFGEYGTVINLGGIANISFDNRNGERIAFDVCPCNLLLNYLAAQAGSEIDENGKLSAGGKNSKKLVQDLNSNEYYKQPLPKSLDKSFVEETFIHLLRQHNLPAEDKLASVCEHIAAQIAAAISLADNQEKTLLTGGGAFNINLVKLLQKKTASQIVVPNSELVNFKEALIFAFLGLQRALNRKNVYKTYTGAEISSIGGALWGKI